MELRFAQPVEIELVEKIKDRLVDTYPIPAGIIQNFQVMATTGGGAPQQARIEPIGQRLTSADATEIVVVSRHNFSTSRLAPYSGWDQFIATVRRNWEVWRKVAGNREIGRIGVRYINRIDVPNPHEVAIPIGDYLEFRPLFPSFDGNEGVETFAINGVIAIANSPFRLILNAGSAPSPLVRTTSFLLDIDISQEGNIPRNDEAIWSLVDQMRVHKNRVFEASITDNSRKLFSS
ncbi:TIGR04255 family protein [Bradyrhizobium sp. ISRA435]|nr:TIGR04255 family protein [Bradyrhizobium sp. ISRA435]